MSEQAITLQEKPSGVWQEVELETKSCHCQQLKNAHISAHLHVVLVPHSFGARLEAAEQAFLMRPCQVHPLIRRAAWRTIYQSVGLVLVLLVSTCNGGFKAKAGHSSWLWRILQQFVLECSDADSASARSYHS